MKAKVAYKELIENPQDFSKPLALHFFTLTLTTNLNLGVERMILLGTLYNYGELLYL